LYNKLLDIKNKAGLQYIDELPINKISYNNGKEVLCLSFNFYSKIEYLAVIAYKLYYLYNCDINILLIGNGVLFLVVDSKYEYLINLFTSLLKNNSKLGNVDIKFDHIKDLNDVYILRLKNIPPNFSLDDILSGFNLDGHLSISRGCILYKIILN